MLVAAVGSVRLTILVLPLLAAARGRFQAGLNTPAMAFIVAAERLRFTYPPLAAIAWSNNCQLLVAEVISPKSKPAPISSSIKLLVEVPAVLALRAAVTSAILLRPGPVPPVTVTVKLAVRVGVP
jgi:hypothetical protein